MSKNLAVMMGAMMLVRSVNQEDPVVLLRTRIGFGIYVLATSIIYFMLHRRIVSRNDRTKIKVPVPKPPFGAESDQPAEERETTHLEYDLDLLKKARQGWMFNTLLLSVVHYKMETVSPLIMSSLMNFVRLVSDDKLFKLHILGAPAVGALKRPFKPDENPLAAMLKNMMPDPNQLNQQQEEELKDDGDDTESEDEQGPRSLADLKDDDDKGDNNAEEKTSNADKANAAAATTKDDEEVIEEEEEDEIQESKKDK